MNKDSENWQGYEWTALSVTTIGTILVSVQETALLIALLRDLDPFADRLPDHNVGNPELHATYYGTCTCGRPPS